MTDKALLHERLHKERILNGAKRLVYVMSFVSEGHQTIVAT